MAISDNIMNWKNIRGKVNELSEKVEEVDGVADYAKEKADDAWDKADDAYTKANQVGIKANNNEANITTIKNQLNGGVCKVYQKNYTVQVSDWNFLNMATIHDANVFKEDWAIVVSPKIGSSADNSLAIAECEIVPLEIASEGYLRLKCKTVPSVDVDFTITAFIPLNITLQ